MRVDLGHRVSAVGDDDPGVREGAPEFVGRALAAGGRHPQLRGAAVPAGPRVSAATAPGAHRCGAGAGGAQRSRAVRAARRAATVGADEGRCVARARDLHEHGPALQGLPRGGERGGRHARLPLFALAGRAQHDPRARAAGGGDLAHVPDVDQTLDVGRARVAREHQGRPLELLAHEGGVASVHPGRERFRQQGVPVVPESDETRVRCGRVDARATADDDARRGRERAQVLRVARRTGLVGVVAHDGVRGHELAEGREQLRLVAVVGDDEYRAASPGQDVHGGGGQQVGPRPARELGVRPRRGVQCQPITGVERLGQSRVRSQDGGDPFAGGGHHLGGLRWRSRGPRLLGADHALGHREPQDVADRARRPVGDAAGERVEAFGENRQGRDDRLHRGQGTLRTVVRDHLDDEGVHHAPG